MLERIVRAKGYYLMVRCVGSCQEIIPMVATWNVDGVVFLSAFRDDVIEIKKIISTKDKYIEDCKESAFEALKKDDRYQEVIQMHGKDYEGIGADFSRCV